METGRNRNPEFSSRPMCLCESYENSGFKKCAGFLVSESSKNLEETKSQIIVTFKGQKYDLTSFAYKHPGGAKYIIGSNGKDIESYMKQFEHSENAYLKLERYKI
jgi:predicted heme/steroid binding protein